MAMDLNDLSAFVAVARAGGFLDAAKPAGMAASSLSEGSPRLEEKLWRVPRTGTMRRSPPPRGGRASADTSGPGAGRSPGPRWRQSTPSRRPCRNTQAQRARHRRPPGAAPCCHCVPEGPPPGQVGRSGLRTGWWMAWPRAAMPASGMTRAVGERHDCGAYWFAATFRDGRLSGLSRRAWQTEASARSAR